MKNTLLSLLVEEQKSRLPSKKQTGFHTNIDKDTTENNNFRKVIFTTPTTQLVLMSLLPGEDIGEESHNGDQFFRFEEGTGIFKLGEEEYNVKDGDAVVVPKGILHNVTNTGNTPLKLYALYAPPQHDANQVDETKPIDETN